MKIRDMHRHIEESLGNISETVLPPQIGGLQLLPVNGFRPRVSVYYAGSGESDKRRKVHENADVSSLDPRTCEIVITFEPIDQLNSGASNLAQKPQQVIAEFNPIRIRGGMASYTVIEDRSDRL